MRDAGYGVDMLPCARSDNHNAGLRRPAFRQQKDGCSSRGLVPDAPPGGSCRLPVEDNAFSLSFGTSKASLL
jgi:hypothetical protein